MFRRAEKNRIIIATFASNISRVQQIINCAKQYGRRVAFSGRSMVNVMGIAGGTWQVEIPEGVLIDIDMINRYPKEQIVIVTTGSQGEPMSALTRMAFADHRKVSVGPGDVIIISARPIPGNEKKRWVLSPMNSQSAVARSFMSQCMKCMFPAMPVRRN